MAPVDGILVDVALPVEPPVRQPRHTVTRGPTGAIGIGGDAPGSPVQCSRPSSHRGLRAAMAGPRSSALCQGTAHQRLRICRRSRQFLKALDELFTLVPRAPPSGHVLSRQLPREFTSHGGWFHLTYKHCKGGRPHVSRLAHRMTHARLLARSLTGAALSLCEALGRQPVSPFEIR